MIRRAVVIRVIPTPGCLTAFVAIMFRRAVVSRVISTPRCLAVFVAIVEIQRAAYSSRKFSESANSFGVFVFSHSFLGL